MGKYINRDKLIMEGWSLQRTYQKDASTMVCEMKKPEDFHAADVVPWIWLEWFANGREMQYASAFVCEAEAAYKEAEP